MSFDERIWRKVKRVTLSFELSRGKDDDIIEFWQAVDGAKVDKLRELTREQIKAEAWAERLAELEDITAAGAA